MIVYVALDYTRGLGVYTTPGLARAALARSLGRDPRSVAWTRWTGDARVMWLPDGLRRGIDWHARVEEHPVVSAREARDR